MIAIFFLPLLFLGLGANDIMGDVFSSPDIIIAYVMHVPYYYFFNLLSIFVLLKTSNVLSFSSPLNVIQSFQGLADQ